MSLACFHDRLTARMAADDKRKISVSLIEASFIEPLSYVEWSYYDDESICQSGKYVYKLTCSFGIKSESSEIETLKLTTPFSK